MMHSNFYGAMAVPTNDQGAMEQTGPQQMSIRGIQRAQSASPYDISPARRLYFALFFSVIGVEK